MEDNTITLDTTSGFSLDEQQQIIDEINSLKVEKGIIPNENAQKDEAKKRGFFFPLLVNAAALVLLAGGLLVLYLVQSKNVEEIRGGSGVSGLTEQRLIDELSARARASEAGLNAAEAELARLRAERETAINAEALLGGQYTVAENFIREGRLDQAAIAITGMKELVESTAFGEARRAIHRAAIAALEGAANLAASSGGEGTAALEARVAELERVNSSQERLVAALQSTGSGNAELIAEYDSRVTDPEARAAEQQQTLVALQSETERLQTESAEKTRHIAELDTRAAALQTEVTNQNQTIAGLNNDITGLNSDIANLRQQNAAVTAERDNLNQRLAALPGLIENAILNEDGFTDLIPNIARPQAEEIIRQIIQRTVTE